MTDPRPGGFYSTSSQSRWTGGPSLEWHLPRRLSVEFNALYRTDQGSALFPLRLGSAQNSYLFHTTDKTRVWDFPLLLKYRFTEGRLRPFLAAGTSWSYRRNEGLNSFSCLGPQDSCTSPENPVGLITGGFRSSHRRFVAAAGAGLEIKTERVRIAPEVRWNQWSGHTRNPFTVLVGFSFGR